MTQEAQVTLPPQAPPKKDQEDLNIDVYKKVFEKCLIAADELIEKRLGTHNANQERSMKVDIAKAIFDRFYNDQNALKQGKQQAEAMMAGLSQVLEGRR